jgi:hypothetical protein
MIIDAKNKTFAFNSIVVGKIDQFDFIDGETPDVIFRPLESPDPTYLPGMVDYGTVKLMLYRDTSDAGQIEMESARVERRTEQCALTLSDGQTRTFSAYVKVMPIIGGSDGAATCTAVLRIASKIT